MIKREFYRFLASVMFFSRIPVPSRALSSEIHYSHAVRYLPWVGFLISAIGAVIMYFSSYILPPVIAVILGVTITILLTGGFHEDGLADVCDGFGGGYSRQHKLDIMKDSHIGTYGVIALILVLFFRITTLGEMPRFFMAVFFIAGNTISRFVLVTVMFKYKYARDEVTSKVNLVIGKLTSWDIIIAFIPVIPAFLITGDVTTFLLIIPVWLTKWALAYYFNQKIGGYTGDCLGAIQQICEVILYISALVWLKFTW